MKLIVHNPEGGDWTVVQDEDGNEVYSGHDSFNQLAQAVLEWANDQVDIEYIVYSDSEFDGKF